MVTLSPSRAPGTVQDASLHCAVQPWIVSTLVSADTLKRVNKCSDNPCSLVSTEENEIMVKPKA